MDSLNKMPRLPFMALQGKVPVPPAAPLAASSVTLRADAAASGHVNANVASPTAPPENPVAEKLIALVEASIAVLTQAADLSPRNHVINDLLSALVDAVDQPHDAATIRAVLESPRVGARLHALHDLLGAAEGAMEATVTRALLDLSMGHPLDPKTLTAFRYYQNYKDLTTLEAAPLNEMTQGMSGNLVMVGAGPLPLTGLFLHLMTGRTVVCLDGDPAAAALGRSLMQALGLGDKVLYETAAGEDYSYNNAAAVLVASLVDNKDGVVKRVAATAAQPVTLAVRSVEGMCHVLYPVYTPGPEAAAHLEPRGQTTAPKGVINTTLFYALRPQP